MNNKRLNEMTANHGTPLILQFRSTDDLWAFRIEALINFIEMDSEKKTLICRCTSEQLQPAMKKYKVSLIMPEQTIEDLNFYY